MLGSLIIPALACALSAASATGNRFATPDTTGASGRADSLRMVADSSVRVTFGAFVDTYVAFDAGRPRTLDRAFTTQAARHAEFNVNLAHVEAALSAPRIRGRMALQAGTSVQVNYAGEPRVGQASGGDLSRVIQEAYVGYEVRKGFWVDAGIFFSNAGLEGWLSRDNPTYTRSLVADYSPYYSSGVRATWQATPALTVRADLVNGWQNISESNEDKAVGARVDYAIGRYTTLSWYGLAGNEPGARLRLFNGVGITGRLSGDLEFMAQADVGREEAPDSLGLEAVARTWAGAMATLRWAVNPRTALSARTEWYDDKDQVIATTGTTSPLRATGGSLGIDRRLASLLTWRTEARALVNREAIFADRRAASGVSRTNLVAVTSLALSF
jgi:hypothetical protein